MKRARSDIEVSSQTVSSEVVTDDSNSDTESDESAFAALMNIVPLRQCLPAA